jgi:hypothetical protein
MTARLTWHVCVCVVCVCVCVHPFVCVCRVQWKAPQDSPYVQEVLCVCVRVRACVCVCVRALANIFLLNFYLCVYFSRDTHEKRTEGSSSLLLRLYC